MRAGVFIGIVALIFACITFPPLLLVVLAVGAALLLTRRRRG